MNIRRGFFRLWLVLSICWILSILALFFQEIEKPYFEGRGFYFPKNITAAQARAVADRNANPAGADWGTYQIQGRDGFKYLAQGQGGTDAYNRIKDALAADAYELKPVTVPRYTDDYRALETGVSNGETQIVTIDGLPEITLFAGLTVPRDELKRQSVEVNRIASELKATLDRKNRIESAKRMALFAFIPPLAIFFVGWVIGWIFAGFRTDKSRSAG